ncbi:hypothetical protein Poli38472_007342 [Pythium oligandrum]|uniref:EF-hand domain-containing protein n=1 Tax=Pythium oligandrum TaxID=41045 RepID=A0A8K1C9S6_PYTOL|nr:hypothetical protein Poli38472_007342 [Pythium oligandrum]|eukprot:TMW59197.1 hypothetical protein Poli38472_007342 [Pythium oligandrum]
MGNALTNGSVLIVITEDSLLRDYKNATVEDYRMAKSNFDSLQETVGDKMTVNEEEFDEIFSLICQDPAEHFSLFDSWSLGKVDVMEVFAVIIVYCKSPFAVKIPLLFDLFDFDHSQEISQTELVLLMLCATRGLCKVVGLERPDTVELELIAQSAFGSIDRDHNNQISLSELTYWITHEPSLMHYLKRFACTRLIYDNQQQYDTMMKQLCDSFVQFSAAVSSMAAALEDQAAGLRHRKQLGCTVGTCAEVIKRHIPQTEPQELTYLIQAMQSAMQRHYPPNGHHPDPGIISLDVFCIVVSSYVAFVVADEDHQRLIDLKELKILLWLVHGKEPTPPIVTSFMQSLDRDENGALNAVEWVSYAVENDARTGDLALSTQLQLLFTLSDRNGDAVLSIQELINGLRPILLEALMKSVGVPPRTPRLPNAQSDSGEHGADGYASTEQDELELDPVMAALRSRRQSQVETIQSLIAVLANELMEVMDKNQSRRIEWFEFRQHLDYLHKRIDETKTYIRDHVLQTK